MNIDKVFDYLNKSNIDQDKVFELVDEAKKMDLTDDDNVRLLIQKGMILSGKSISKEEENRIVETIKKEGITPDLLKLL